ncbi:DNA ligase 1 [Galdieria sulphuraria]|nr:DNA ligase 1 [Galdieria sulphuraria]
MRTRLCFLIPSVHKIFYVQRASLTMKRKASNISPRKQPSTIPKSSIGSYLSILQKEEPSSLDTERQAKENVDQNTNDMRLESQQGSETSSSTSEHSSSLVENAKVVCEEKLDECTFSSVSWQPPSRTPFRFLAEAFEVMEATTSRLALIKILTQVFRKIVNTTPDDLLPCVYLCTNMLGPAHEGLELKAGEATVLNALSSATGNSVKVLKERLIKLGDIGDLAAECRTTQQTMFKPPSLTIQGVYQEFRTMANLAGKMSTKEREKHLQKLLVSATSQEAKYIARIVLGKLRIHIAYKTVIASLATVFAPCSKTVGKTADEMDSIVKEATATLNAVYSQLPMWDRIIPVLIQNKSTQGLEDHCRLTPGVPVGPMLAKPAKEASDVLERFQECSFVCEYKYDGMRAQIHYLPDGNVKIFSRNAEDDTPKYPDIVENIKFALSKNKAVRSFIIDSEVVAYDPETNVMKSFQELQGRARKEVKLEDIKWSLKERREKLIETFSPVQGKFQFTTSKVFTDWEGVDEMMDEAIQAGCEGLMIKALTGEYSSYEPSNRSQNWLKMKKDYMNSIGDSLDLVPIGAYYGRGKRSGVFGAFLLACYNSETEEFQTVCKLGTGFSDEFLSSITKFYKDGHILAEPKPYYGVSDSPTIIPDVWFDPCQVWETRCADLTLSPSHTAAKGMLSEEDKGIALRFPRFIRIREDKSVDDATTAEQIVELYSNQKSKM